ncbi:hypothetical protein [Henriciella litoralis]|uniref:hypothetical protein n=1 Tax=Henriciella litoralis TaxID=568102 RepID=UPI00111C20E9|nr:hypothetical protein [Henriciella litoralis]
MLTGALDSLDSFFGDPGPEQPALRRYLHWAALDRCLLIALLYPVLTLLVIWHLTGIVGPAGAALDIPPDLSAQQRLASGISLTILLASALWALSPPLVHQTFKWSLVRFATFAVASAVAGAVAVAVTGAVALAGAVAGAFAVAGAVAGAGAFAVALAVAGAVVSAVGITGAFVVLVAINSDSLSRRRLSVLTIVITAHLAGFCIIVRFGNVSASNWVLLVFLGALPLLNAVFDWLSISATRYLLRRGQEPGGPGPFAMAALDLVLATTLLFLLMLVTISYIGLLNHLSLAGGGQPALQLRPLLAELRSDNPGPQVWWIYVTVFTTFVPSLVNLTLGWLAAIRGIPALRRLAMQHFLPEDPAQLDVLNRFWASTILAIQLLVAILGALAVCLALISLSLYGLSFIGANLLDVADWIIGYLEPSKSP